MEFSLRQMRVSHGESAAVVDGKPPEIAGYRAPGLCFSLVSLGGRVSGGGRPAVAPGLSSHGCALSPGARAAVPLALGPQSSLADLSSFAGHRLRSEERRVGK